MGIVNVTPDSFSDGGLYFDTSRAVEQGLRLVAEGAAIIDVGGESTRPFSQPVPVEEELRRVLPVIELLAAQTAVPVSIDTTKAAVAREALAAGAQIINDTSGLTGDPAMLDTALAGNAAVVVMHSQGDPQTMQINPHYSDTVSEIHQWLARRKNELLAAGIAADRIALDPGIGFGKTATHNLELIRSIDRFHDLGCVLTVGHSRKRFIGQVLGDDQADRTFGALGVALALARRGVQVLRMHHVAGARQALALFAACGGLENNPI